MDIIVVIDIVGANSRNNELLLRRSVTICPLERRADFTYVYYTRGVRGREKLLTQIPPPVKKIF